MWQWGIYRVQGVEIRHAVGGCDHRGASIVDIMSTWLFIEGTNIFMPKIYVLQIWVCTLIRRDDCTNCNTEPSMFWNLWTLFEMALHVSSSFACDVYIIWIEALKTTNSSIRHCRSCDGPFYIEAIVRSNFPEDMNFYAFTYCCQIGHGNKIKDRICSSMWLVCKFIYNCHHIRASGNV